MTVDRYDTYRRKLASIKEQNKEIENRNNFIYYLATIKEFQGVCEYETVIKFKLHYSACYKEHLTKLAKGWYNQNAKRNDSGKFNHGDIEVLEGDCEAIYKYVYDNLPPLIVQDMTV